jgi:histidinol-phosphate aminotransferase
MKYTREILRDVAGYVPGEQPTRPDVVKLNTNENPYPPSPKVTEALREMGEGSVRKYPDPVAFGLRRACAERYGYPDESWVIAGNGMDELLALAIRSFADPGDTVITPYPTYVLYETLSKLHGARLQFIDLDDSFQMTDAFFSSPARICFMPRPNSPSGVCASLEDVERLCRTFDGLVVVDEAYVDFADESCIDFPRRFDNVIVMRTFSKSFSLAGLRLGLAFAQPALIAEFLKTKDSYNLNAATQAAGLAAIHDYGHMQENVDKVRATRERLIAGLRELRFDVPPSQANFVLARRASTPSAKEIFERLTARGILVRYFDARRLEDALRISVGTDEETDILLVALREVLS